MRNPLRKLRPIKWFWQRGRRGWADCDTWALDHYLEGILSEALSYLGDHRMGSPPQLCPDRDEQGMCQETGECSCHHLWSVELYRAAEMFKRLHAEDFRGDSREEQNLRDDAVAWLFKWWGALWD